MKKYWRCNEWAEFTEMCERNAGYKCEFCDRSADRITLNTHHPEYVFGKKPWEYPVEFCVVLCSRCHAEEHGLVPPRGGWTLLHSDWESGEPSCDWECERPGCGATLKWHNVLFHPSWGEIIVGYECAERLEVPELHEAKKLHERRKRFTISPHWKETGKGFLYKYGDRKVFVYRRSSQSFSLNINNVWGKYSYESLGKAKWMAARVVIR